MAPAAPDPAPEAACLNCGAGLVGPFCHACGQRDEPPELPARRIVQDALGDLFAWDGRVAQSLRTLVRHPGVLAEDWAAGRRARHVPPFRLYLLVSLVYVGLTAGYETAKDVFVVDPVEAVDDDEEDLRESLKGFVPVAKVPALVAYAQAVISLGSRWMFVLMPLGGFGLFVLYGLRRRSYAAHFVLAIHVFTVVMLLLAARRLLQLAVAVLVQQRLGEALHGASDGLALLLFVVATGYAAASIRRFYGVGWGKAVLSAPAVTVGPVAGWVAIFIAGWMLILVLP